MRTSTKSQLKTYKVIDTYTTPVGPDNKEKKVAEVQCPRCKGVFVVVIKLFWQLSAWEKRRQKPKIGRSCPYCYLASWVPRKPR